MSRSTRITEEEIREALNLVNQKDFDIMCTGNNVLLAWIYKSCNFDISTKRLREELTSALNQIEAIE